MKFLSIILLLGSLQAAAYPLEECVSRLDSRAEEIKRNYPLVVFQLDRSLYRMIEGAYQVKANAKLVESFRESTRQDSIQQIAYWNAVEGCESYLETLNRRVTSFMRFGLSCVATLLLIFAYYISWKISQLRREIVNKKRRLPYPSGGDESRSHD